MALQRCCCAAFVAVTQLATRSDLNFYHLAAVMLFAVALPMLVIAADVNREEPTGMTPGWRARVHWLGASGAGLFMVATTLLFYSFSRWVGLGFIASQVLIFFSVLQERNVESKAPCIGRHWPLAMRVQAFGNAVASGLQTR